MDSDSDLFIKIPVQTITMCKFLLTIFWFAFLQQTFAQPYVFYKGKQIIVKTLDSNIVNTEVFPVSEKEQVSVNVRFRNNKSWNFSVNLKAFGNDSTEFNPSDTILFLSDIEGEFGLLRQLLISNGVINEHYEWTFGHGQLIICGDLLDRGKGVTQELWLLYKLEILAPAQGGSVHVLLGNHEIMELSGDLRYLDPGYYQQARLLNKDYMDLFSDDTELGRWLRSKNIILKTGIFLCTHGGISKEVLDRKMSIESINERVRPFYDQWRKDIPPNLDVFFNENSPFWYRGYFDKPNDKQKLVAATLERYNAKKIIVGHTEFLEVESYYHGQVWNINTNWHVGNAQGLLVEHDKFYRVDSDGIRMLME